MSWLNYTTYTTYTVMSDAQERQFMLNAVNSAPAWTFKGVLHSVAVGMEKAFLELASFCGEVGKALAQARIRNINISAA